MVWDSYSPIERLPTGTTMTPPTVKCSVGAPQPWATSILRRRCSWVASRTLSLWLCIDYPQ